MKKIVLALLASLLVSVSASQTKKYDIKSGIITFETTMKMTGMEVKTKSIVYFDDYGMKECKETYQEGTLKESFFSDGKNLYSVDFEGKAAWKRGPPTGGQNSGSIGARYPTKTKRPGKQSSEERRLLQGKNASPLNTPTVEPRQHMPDGITFAY